MNIDLFIRRPVLAAGISIIIILLGIISLLGLPVEKYPNMAPPTVVVSANYTGANAQTVQRSVIAPLEEAINGGEHDLHHIYCSCRRPSYHHGLLPPRNGC